MPPPSEFADLTDKHLYLMSNSEKFNCNYWWRCISYALFILNW